MADLWLVDSSAWIFALRPSPQPLIRRRVDELLADNRVAIVGIVELEILGGVRTEPEFSELRELLLGLHRIETRETDWSAAARLVFLIRRAGRTVPFTDALIAQLARRAGASILHADRDFTLLCRRFQIPHEDYSGAITPKG